MDYFLSSMDQDPIQNDWFRITIKVVVSRSMLPKFAWPKNLARGISIIYKYIV